MTGSAQNTKVRALLSLSLALFTWAGSAAAEEDLGEQAECVRAYEAAQERRAANDLIQARDELKVCLQDHCRDFIRSACSQWFEEVEATLPSVVFNVKRAGRDVSEIKVWNGDSLLAETLTGQSVELNPGKYVFRFEAAGSPEVSREILLRAGELNRVVAVELEGVAPKPAPKPEPPPRAAATRPLVLPIALFATGAFALGSFATFGAIGLSQESDLEQRCAPACDQAELDSVRTKYLIADVSLGVGVVALIAGGYFLFRPLEQAEAPPPQSSSLSFDLKSHRHGGLATLSGRF